MHLPIAPALDRPTLVVDLIGDLDSVLAEIAAETLAAHEARIEAFDLTLDLSHVARFVPDGIRDLGRLVASRRLAGRTTTLMVDNARLRTKLEALGIASVAASAPAHAPGRHVMIARHAPLR